MLIDTHAHLDKLQLTSDLESVITRAIDAGVRCILTIGTGIESSRLAVALAEKFPPLYAVVGVHPTDLTEECQDFLGPLRELALHPKVAAIGETGLDYHHLPSKEAQLRILEASQLDHQSSERIDTTVLDKAYKSLQAKAFLQHLDLAAQLGHNVVVHQRDALEDTLQLLAPYSSQLRAVFHCFGGTIKQAHEIISGGHLISFTGMVTFKKAGSVRQTVTQVPYNTYMIETDCPYLTPVPYRGKQCEPAHVRIVAEAISQMRGESLAIVAQHTTNTAKAFFRLSGLI